MSEAAVEAGLFSERRLQSKLQLSNVVVPAHSYSPKPYLDKLSVDCF